MLLSAKNLQANNNGHPDADHGRHRSQFQNHEPNERRKRPNAHRGPDLLHQQKGSLQTGWD